MKKFSYAVISIFVVFLFVGCGHKIDTPVTVEDVEVTEQPSIGGNTIILKMVDDSGNRLTLISLKATENELRVIKCARKGDEITVRFLSSAGGNIVFEAITNHTLGIECQ